MTNVIERYHDVLRELQCDRQTAATLVLADCISVLVTAVTNVNQAVEQIEAQTIRNIPLKTTNKAVSDPVPDIQEIIHTVNLPDVHIHIPHEAIRAAREQLGLNNK